MESESVNVDGAQQKEESPETFGMCDTLASGASTAISIKAGRNKHGKGVRKLPQMAVSPMRDESKQLVALATANSKRTRRPRNGPKDIRGNPKKGGGGGKGTWGKITDVLDGKAAADSRDPNYDSSTEDDVVMMESAPRVEEADVGRIVLPLFKEYCTHGKSEEFIDAVEQYNMANVEYQMVISIIEYALEHTLYARELTSILISDMYGVLLSANDYSIAFGFLLDNLGDLALDTPDCAKAMGKFMARSIADDCLPPAFLKSVDVGDRPCVKEAVDHADLLLGMSHGLARLDSVWGPVLGGLRPVKTLERDMLIILKEFLSSDQLDECGRCLKDLNVPHFNHEFVYLAIMLVLEADQASVPASIARCLKYLRDQEFITPAQLERGFVRIFDNVEDIRLDVPFVYSVLSSFGARCQSAGVISKELYDQIPTRNRQRFVSDSEGDTYIEEASPGSLK